MKSDRGNLKTIFISFSSIFLLTSPATAQLIPDRTLGGENSRVVPVSPRRDNIEGGATRGSNLFHSFREFNVNVGREVYFVNTPGVQNIINRVTGGNISNIFGTLGVEGNANLYLINPNGIVFGNGARLDINGSFIGTTADGVRLGANDVYSATDPGQSSLLTIRPEALFVNRVKRPIQRQIRLIEGANLQVPPGQNITLSADAIDIVDSSSIIAPGGSIFLEAINGGINLGIYNPNGFTDNKGSLDAISTTGNGGNISLNATGGDININGVIDASSDGFGNGGNVNIVSDRNINLDFDAAIFSVGILGGNINLSSVGDTTLFSNAQISSISNGNTPIPGSKGGNISIGANSFSLLDGAFISTDTFGNANGGTIDIQGRSSVIISGIPRFAGARSDAITADSFSSGNGGSIFINTPLLEVSNLATVSADNELGEGNGGSITINTNSLGIFNGATISANTCPDNDCSSNFFQGIGNGGSIDINAGSIEIIGVDTFNEKISSITADNFGFGDRGSITINTGSLRILEGGLISSNTVGDNLFGTGIEGNIKINAQSIELNGFTGSDVSSITANNFSNQFGRTGGDIDINTNSLLIRNGGSIIADTFAAGNGGNININARYSIKISDINEFSFDSFTGIISTSTEGEGQAGNISIATDSLSIQNGGLIRSDTIADGNAGLINVRANSIEITGSNPANSSFDSGLVTVSNGRGNPGDIRIDTNTLRVLNGGEINADNIFTESGRAGTTGGNINIQQAQLIEVISADSDSNSRISSESLGFSGDAGNIEINTGRLRLRDGGEISTGITEFRTLGNAGDINIRSQSIEINGINNIDRETPSAIVTRNLGQGSAGNVSILTDSLQLLNGGRILSDSTGEISGSGDINISSQSLEIVGVDPLIYSIPSGILSETRGTGKGGDITINTDTLQLKDGGIIRASSVFNPNNPNPGTNEGDAGNIAITARNIEITGLNSSLLSETEGAGKAGNININTSRLAIQNGARISGSTSGSGTGGDVNINNNITPANRVEIIGSSGIFTETTGAGNAGNATVNTRNLLISDRGTISATSASNATGNSGSIGIFSENIRIANNGSVQVSNLGTGTGGNIDINADNLGLDRGLINAESNAIQGGDITLILREFLTVSDRSRISATSGISGGAGNGGNITIESPFIFAFSRDNAIEANAFLGSGGNINIATNAIFGYPQFIDITASSDLGIDGTIAITGLNDEISRGDLLTLSPPIDAAEIMANDVCAVKDGEVAGGSSFTIPGKGGIIPNPLETVERTRRNVEWTNRPDSETKIRKRTKVSDRQAEPRKVSKPAVGWYRRTDGTVVLTSNPALVRPLNQPIDYPEGCE